MPQGSVAFSPNGMNPFGLLPSIAPVGFDSSADPVVIGSGAIYLGTDPAHAVVIGINAVVHLEGGVAVGSNAVAEGFDGVALGGGSWAQPDFSIAIGEAHVQATGSDRNAAKYGIAVGIGSTVGHPSIAVGFSGIALGHSSTVTADYGIAIGDGALVDISCTGGVSIGYAAHALAAQSVAIGYQAEATRAGEIALGASSANPAYLSCAGADGIVILGDDLNRYRITVVSGALHVALA